jgi:hypothetical protein
MSVSRPAASEATVSGCCSESPGANNGCCPDRIGQSRADRPALPLRKDVPEDRDLVRSGSLLEAMVSCRRAGGIFGDAVPVNGNARYKIDWMLSELVDVIEGPLLKHPDFEPDLEQIDALALAVRQLAVSITGQIEEAQDVESYRESCVAPNAVALNRNGR